MKKPAGARFGYRAAAPGNDQFIRLRVILRTRESFIIKKNKTPPERVWLSCGSAGNDSVLSDYAFICVRVSLLL
ncbi:hypothetical protein J6N75_00045 [Serratia marcescens subsp. marcescens ATCC 13880]|uniref:hypothetical protein n=1 Tax=Serratia marcescens TaxID=615 RepID=UPI001AD65147|nr:hypothetical protein [Serratia marcescens]QTI64268.1 hypothetical protein J6N75_00045 [Serratia marcescens subsp. marcescens ATCC 13880]